MRGKQSVRAGLVIAIVASCAAPPPSSPPLGQPEPPRIVLPKPGRPYTAANMLTVLRAAPRSQLSADLVRPEVAEALSLAVWTFDGRPYRVVVAEGSCVPRGCQVSVQGAPNPADEVRSDHYIFDIDLDRFELSPKYVGLRAFPAELHPQLDAIARAALPRDRLEGLAYDSAIWLPPPEFGRFEVTYDEGGLEGSRGLRVLVDARVGSVIRVEEFIR
jgi:hypothetical protein